MSNLFPKELADVLEPKGKCRQLIQYIEGRGKDARYDEVIAWASRINGIAELKEMFSLGYIVPADGYYLTIRDVLVVIQAMREQTPGLHFTVEVVAETMNEPLLSVTYAMRTLATLGYVNRQEGSSCEVAA
jgi:2C-methyl-D-erythritol 2,4-cyclodiphosphate synthase